MGTTFPLSGISAARLYSWFLSSIYNRGLLQSMMLYSTQNLHIYHHANVNVTFSDKLRHPIFQIFTYTLFKPLPPHWEIHCCLETTKDITLCINQGEQFWIKLGTTPNSRSQMDKTKQVPHWGLKTIIHQHTNISAPLIKSHISTRN